MHLACKLNVFVIQTHALSHESGPVEQECDGMVELALYRCASCVRRRHVLKTVVHADSRADDMPVHLYVHPHVFANHTSPWLRGHRGVRCGCACMLVLAVAGQAIEPRLIIGKQTSTMLRHMHDMLTQPTVLELMS